MSANANYIGDWDTFLSSIVAGHGTSLAPIFIPAVLTAGQANRIHSMVVSNVDGSNQKLLNVFRAKARTKPGDAGTLAIATSTTITRTTGSFIADGWNVGKRLAIIDPTRKDGGLTTPANQKAAIVTTVAALTLTLSAAAYTAEALPANAAIYELAQLTVASIPAGAGTTSGSPQPELILSTKYMPQTPNRPDSNLIVGPDDLLLGGVTVAMGANTSLEFATEYGAW